MTEVEITINIETTREFSCAEENQLRESLRNCLVNETPEDMGFDSLGIDVVQSQD